jgi:hypothetical protein
MRSDRDQEDRNQICQERSVHEPKSCIDRAGSQSTLARARVRSHNRAATPNVAHGHCAVEAVDLDATAAVATSTE